MIRLRSSLSLILALSFAAPAHGQRIFSDSRLRGAYAIRLDHVAGQFPKVLSRDHRGAGALIFAHKLLGLSLCRPRRLPSHQSELATRAHNSCACGGRSMWPRRKPRPADVIRQYCRAFERQLHLAARVRKLYGRYIAEARGLRVRRARPQAGMRLWRQHDGRRRPGARHDRIQHAAGFQAHVLPSGERRRRRVPRFVQGQHRRVHHHRRFGWTSRPGADGRARDRPP